MNTGNSNQKVICETIAEVFPSEFEIAGEADYVVECLRGVEKKDLPNKTGLRFDASAVNAFIATLVPVVIAGLQYLEACKKDGNETREIVSRSEEIEKVLLQKAEELGCRIAKPKVAELAKAIAKRVK
ncbi:MAG: hypothetical protein WCO56_29015 [Verrucomicrobiota bacterium]